MGNLLDFPPLKSKESWIIIVANNDVYTISKTLMEEWKSGDSAMPKVVFAWMLQLLARQMLNSLLKTDTLSPITSA